MNRYLAPIASTLFLTACISIHSQAPAPARPTSAVEQGSHELLDATLWLQTSAEYRALALQSYDMATRTLDRALADPTWTAALEQTGDFSRLPPAVILDVDETVLDNSALEARLIERNIPYNEDLWNKWVDEAAAPPIPGALEFTKYAASKGVTVFYVTNRNVKVEPQTRRNLEKFGFPMRSDVDTVLLVAERPDWTSEKITRRAFVAQNYRVLMLFGDDLGDFANGVRTTGAERFAIVESNRANWGTKWFVLPNPMYGSWEQSVLGFRRGLPPSEQLQIKRDALRRQE